MAKIYRFLYRKSGEEVKKRSLEYYTEFVEKSMRQYVLKVFKK
jgi:hypothetical protein